MWRWSNKNEESGRGSSIFDVFSGLHQKFKGGKKKLDDEEDLAIEMADFRGSVEKFGQTDEVQMGDNPIHGGVDKGEDDDRLSMGERIKKKARNYGVGVKNRQAPMMPSTSLNVLPCERDWKRFR